MGDLDNFFAKKDKKKVKGRKYDNPDEIAKRLKESEKKLEKELCRVEPVKKSFDEVLSTTTSASLGNESAQQETKAEKEEEEWKDFMDEAQKDLTNLKITKLQIEDEDDGVLGYGSGEDEGGSNVGTKSDGVWKKNLDRLENEQANTESETVVPLSTHEESKTKSSYVPPHLRNVASPLPKGGSRKTKIAPDITSAMAFPSLSDAQTAMPPGAWGRKRMGEERAFESVKHGSTKTLTESYAPPKLSTANRFDALSESS